MILKLKMQHQELKRYKVGINGDPRLTLTYFTAKPNWSPVHLKGKNCYKVIKWENLQQMTRLTEDLCLKKRLPQVVVCPRPGAIYMYMTIFFLHLFSLKPLGQSRPNFKWSLLDKRDTDSVKMVLVT